MRIPSTSTNTSIQSLIKKMCVVSKKGEGGEAFNSLMKGGMNLIVGHKYHNWLHQCKINEKRETRLKRTRENCPRTFL